MTPERLSRRGFVTAVGGFLTPVHLLESLKLASCGPHSDHNHPVLAGIDQFACDDTLLPAFGKQHAVFFRGSGRGVLILHELPGMTPSDIDFAYRLSEEGFRVFLPLLFGRPGEDRFERRLFSECVFGRWPWEEIAPKNPWVPPLLGLCSRIAEKTGGPIGVVGMCLTGIMPISLMSCAHVVAPVVSQPTMPLPIDAKRSAALGLGPGEAARACARLEREDLQILAFRASTDCFCSSPRFDTLEEEFRGHVLRHDINFGSVHGHSILAAEFHRSDAPKGVKKAFDRTVTFLRDRLT